MYSRAVQQELEAGIKGYEVKLWHHDTQKPIAFGIHKHSRPHHYLDELMRIKAEVPAPTSYNLRKGFEIKRNVMNQNAPRITSINEMMLQSKKDRFPDSQIDNSHPVNSERSNG